MKYLRKFSQHADYNQFSNQWGDENDSYKLPNVSLCKLQRHVHYNPKNKMYIKLRFDIGNPDLEKDNWGTIEDAPYKRIFSDWGYYNVIQKYMLGGDEISPSELEEKDSVLDLPRGKYVSRVLIDPNKWSYSTGWEGYFARLHSLIDAEIPQGAESINAEFFYECINLSGVTIPSSVKIIAPYAFECCYELKDIDFKEGLEKILYGAFDSCGLNSVDLPSTVSVIGWETNENTFNNASYINPFCENENITSMTVSEDNEVFDSRDNCNAIIETATNNLRCGCKNTIIPNSVETIERFAFYIMGLGGALNMGRNVKTIKSYSFEKNNITSLTINDGCETIEKGAFIENYNLKSVYISKSVTQIGDSDSVAAYSRTYDVFRSCSGLTSIIVDDENTVYDSRDNCNAIVKKNDNSIIAGCNTTTIPTTVTTLRQNSFVSVPLMDYIKIGSNITSIETNTFSVDKIDSIGVPSYGLDISEVGMTTYYGIISSYKEMKVVDMPSNITTLNIYKLHGRGLVSTSQIDNNRLFRSKGATEIRGCRISDYDYLYNIELVDLPSTLRIFGRRAISNKNGRNTESYDNNKSGFVTKNLICRATTPPDIYSGSNTKLTTANDSIWKQFFYIVITGQNEYGNNIIEKRDSNIYVPSEAVSAYQSAPGWRNYTIHPISDYTGKTADEMIADYIAEKQGN